MLEPADPDTLVQTTFRYEPEEEHEFEVEKILSHRGHPLQTIHDYDRNREFLIK